MAAKSGRKNIKAPTEVIVTNFKELTKNLGIIYYNNSKNEEVCDIYNVDIEAVMNTLELAEAGEKVRALLGPDDNDLDSHPECLGAAVIQEPTPETPAVDVVVEPQA